MNLSGQKLAELDLPQNADRGGYMHCKCNQLENAEGDQVKASIRMENVIAWKSLGQPSEGSNSTRTA